MSEEEKKELELEVSELEDGSVTVDNLPEEEEQPEVVEESETQMKSLNRLQRKMSKTKKMILIPLIAKLKMILNLKIQTKIAKELGKLAAKSGS